MIIFTYLLIFYSFFILFFSQRKDLVIRWVTYPFNYPVAKKIVSLWMQDYKFVLEVIFHGIHNAYQGKTKLSHDKELYCLSGMYIFYLNPTLYNFEVCSFIFIRLKLPILLVKTVKNRGHSTKRRVTHLLYFKYERRIAQGF